MSFVKLFCFIFLAVSVLKCEANTTLSNGTQGNCFIELKKETPLNGGREVSIKVDTRIKADISSLREMIKAEFAQQQIELQRQKQELTNMIRKEFAEQKSSMEKFIRNESQSLRALISQELEKVCSKEFQTKHQQLLENINKNLSNQFKSQENSLAGALKTMEPRTAELRKWDKNFNCTENCGPIMDLPRSCEAAMATAASRDGVYLLKIEGSPLKPFYAYCQRMDDQVWTVVQRREDGSVDFYRSWTEYKHGFGNLYGEFWLGLERLNALTSGHRHELHVWMKSKSGATAYARYGQFAVGNETEKYRLTVSQYSGTAGDELILSSDARHNGMKFSTYDNCNDNHREGNEECARTYHGAWWFNKCYNSHLNGPYKWTTKNGVDWDKFSKQLVYARMAIRRV